MARASEKRWQATIPDEFATGFRACGKEFAVAGVAQRHEPLAQTSDTRQLIAVGAATVGAGLTCLGLHIKRNQ